MKDATPKLDACNTNHTTAHLALKSVLEFKSDAELKAEERHETSLHAWPDSVLHPKGIVGEVANWILSSAGIKQPKFSLAAALVICSTLLGRLVKDHSGERTNIFVLVVIPSSGGKDHPFKAGMKLLLALDRSHLLTGEVTSDSALECLLTANPTRCMFLDEVGDYLGSIKAAGHSNAYLKTIMPRLKSLWSSSNDIYIGKTRAADNNGKWREPTRIVAPHLSIYGTGSPTPLFESLSERDFDDGTAPRFITFISEEIPLRQDLPEATPPAGLLEKIKDALQHFGSQPNTQTSDRETNPASIGKVIPSDDEAKQIFAEFERFKYEQINMAKDDPPLYLWGKAVQNAKRIALIVACFRNPKKPIIGKYDAQYAVNLMRCSVNEMIDHSRELVGVSWRERELKRIEGIIRQAKTEGISQSNLTRKTPKMVPSERNDLLWALEEMKTIVRQEKPGTGKKPETWFYHTHFIK